jgi:hypothetical protein
LEWEVTAWRDHLDDSDAVVRVEGFLHLLAISWHADHAWDLDRNGDARVRHLTGDRRTSEGLGENWPAAVFLG